MNMNDDEHDGGDEGGCPCIRTKQDVPIGLFLAGCWLVAVGVAVWLFTEEHNET